jgi:hypothetical protein
MSDAEARKRTVLALERIADALEAANASDPLRAIERALAGKQPDVPATDPAESASPLPPAEQWRTR